MKPGQSKKNLAKYEQQKRLQKLKQCNREVKKDVLQVFTKVKSHEAKSVNKPKKIQKEVTFEKKPIPLSLIKTVHVNETKNKDVSLAFANNMDTLIKTAHVILFVLDARDPMGTRCEEMERRIQNENKTFVFILNKIDLVDSTNMRQWTQYLSKFGQVIPFKCSTQKQANRLGVNAGATMPSRETASNNASYGVDNVICQLRMIYREKFNDGQRHKNGAMIMKVGVLGMPNTGKSSFINSLKRKKICEAGNTPGLTRHLKDVAIDKHITLIDSPGVVLSTSLDPAEVALKNCTRIEKIEDPEAVAQVIYNRCMKHELTNLYGLADYSSYEDLLYQLAKKFCPLMKGGILNIKAAAVKLLRDWTNGEIYYSSEPPIHETINVAHNVERMTE